MADDKKTGKIDPFTEGYVRKSARQLVGKFGFTKSDRGDIEQKLYLKLAKHLPCDDPENPKWKAFVALAVKRCIANIVRDKQAEKRDHRRVCSIHVVIGEDDEGAVELADTISEQESRSRRGRSYRSQQELAELLMDVAACIADLPDARHREFCERLKHDSISQAARDMDIPRTTLHAWIGKLLATFEDKGLKDYL